MMAYTRASAKLLDGNVWHWSDIRTQPNVVWAEQKKNKAEEKLVR